MSKAKSSEDERKPKPEKSEREKVREWLDVNGYPLEMRTARAFYATNKFSVDQSHYYVDASGTPHEVDVMAIRHSPVELDAHTHIYADVRVIAECKSNARSEKPWVVMTTETNEVNQFMTFDHYAVSTVASDTVEWIKENGAPSDLMILAMPDRAGYGIACANIHQLKDNNDLAYRAVNKLVQACRAHAPTDDALSFSLVVPVLAVSTNLYEVTLGSNHEPIVRQKQHIPLIWRRPADGDPDGFPLLVHVVHVEWMERFAHQIANTFDHITSKFAQTIANAAVAHMKQKQKTKTPKP